MDRPAAGVDDFVNAGRWAEYRPAAGAYPAAGSALPACAMVWAATNQLGG